MEKTKRGFTIIELIVVMSIILVLAGLLTGAAMKAKQRAMVAQARAMISGLETALGMFQADVGGYPTGNGAAGSTANLVNALTANTGSCISGTVAFNLPNANWAGPYINFKQGERVGGTIRDPWGREYMYASLGYNHGGGIDYSITGSSYVSMWSMGADGISNGIPPAGDDIGNWGR